jgi:hypothetical protein
MLPGFTAWAALGNHHLPRAWFHKEFNLAGGVVRPAIPGRPEQRYIDCTADCRSSGVRGGALLNCIQGCGGPSRGGSSGGAGSGSSGSQGSTPPSSPCPGKTFVACPDGTVGCCPNWLPKCAVLPFFGVSCVPF